MNDYYKIYNYFLTAIKKDNPYGTPPKISGGNTKNIKNALLKFLITLEKITTSSKLKYQDISIFVLTDPKFFFPHKKSNITLDDYGAHLKVSTKGLLYQIFQALDLSRHFNLVIKLYNLLSDLHLYLSMNDIPSVEIYKNKTLKLLKKLKELVI
ncbi:MAG: hypothetical protein KatS3mg094_098 [Candidatus Parcubacteria bacterium]|nr:MAG: hypothetical protein KatS3mg094_098 [Candidatus Parcubacteria bacterium]